MPRFSPRAMAAGMGMVACVASGGYAVAALRCMLELTGARLMELEAPAIWDEAGL